MEGTKSNNKVIVIGAGAVAGWMAPAIDALPGYRVVAVASRTLEHAQALAAKLQDAEATTVDALPPADIYLISTSDDAIAGIAARTASAGLWIHTSGSVPITALAGKERAAVLYPLQTFSRTHVEPWAPRLLDGPHAEPWAVRGAERRPAKAAADAIPLFVEASDEEAFKQVQALALALSPRVYEADSEHRRALHVAAVFACNFTNRLWAHAEDILQKAGYPLDVLHPLLQKTLDKAMAISPVEGQTGPARRGDRRILESHLASLDGVEKEIYQLISNDILSQYNHPEL
ncbi:MAG: DUF2520 domain-containing protein [Bacteroidales bacterium]|nr:DUF2520 domain-containing protein [Bacteroidales bacterium]